MEQLATSENMISKEDYYKDSGSVSFSALKVFSKCETLYRDIFVDKTYEEPEYDYFVYGKLVDAMVTEKPEFIPENFVRVERKIKPEDALKFENQIKDLEKEIDEKEKQNDAKKADKRAALEKKMNDVSIKMTAKREKDPKASVTAELEKIQGLQEEIKNLPGDKTIEKGIESRRSQVAEIKAQLATIKQLADKIQVTNSIWVNAEETALALKAHPSYSNLEFNEATSQRIFTSNRGGIPRKGKLDHLKLSPSLTRYYAIYAAGQMTLEDLQQRIRDDVHPQDLWAIITDIKTCKNVRELEPFNKHYRGQLGFYQDLVSDTLLIPITNIRCRILVADKLNNDFKKCELFEYTQAALDELKPDVEAWVRIWWERQQTKKYVSAKEKSGWHQKCFTCSECRFCPFSTRPGDPVVVNGPRFTSEGDAAPLVDDISTADAALEY